MEKGKKKIVIVVGARPQFIKVALLINELKKWSSVVLIHTGQHYDHNLSGTFFEQMDIMEPTYNLNVGSGTHGRQTGEMLVQIESKLIDEQPDLMLVVGDTNSTLAGALTASKLHIPVGHIEAGMRNFDRKKPEEINRILTDDLSDILFAPTPNASKNLMREGIRENVFIVGDISNDVFVRNIPRAQKTSTIVDDLQLDPGNYHVLTIHKSKNTDSRKNLGAILQTISGVDDKMVFPIHPRTRKVIESYGLQNYLDSDSIQVIDPVSYLDMINLCKNARKIITDSGGIQKEAYALKKPCITMRKTEWIETVQDGWNIEVDIHNQNEFREAVLNFEPVKPQSDFLGSGDTYLKINDLLCSQSLF